MIEKPTTAEGYKSGQVELVRATCLYLAIKLGDIIDDLVDGRAHHFYRRG